MATEHQDIEKDRARIYYQTAQEKMERSEATTHNDVSARYANQATAYAALAQYHLLRASLR